MAASAESVWATHLRAGEITVERVSCNSLTFRITVTVFTNTINTNVLFGGEDDWLDFGDGHRMLIPEQENVPRPGGIWRVTAEGAETKNLPAADPVTGLRRWHSRPGVPWIWAKYSGATELPAAKAIGWRNSSTRLFISPSHPSKIEPPAHGSFQTAARRGAPGRRSRPGEPGPRPGQWRGCRRQV